MRTRKAAYIGLFLGAGCLCWIRINQAYAPYAKQLAVAQSIDDSPPLTPIETRTRSDILMTRALFSIPDNGRTAEPQIVGNQLANPNQTFRLVGVIINDRTSLALIKVSEEIMRVAAGQKIGEWKVLRVGNRDVLLESNAQIRRLLLDESRVPKNEVNGRSLR